MNSKGIPTRSKLLILTAVMASLLEIIDTSIVNVSIPSMMGNLGATLDEISWVITGYIIANAIVLPISGWLSEQFGRKHYYTACIILFTAASVACGLSPNLTTLVVCRVLQGLAGGALLPTSQSLIYEAFPKEQAGMASAIYGMSVMIGPTLGPTLGGYLTDHFGWRSIFNINLPVGIFVAILSWILVEDVGFVPQTKAEKAAQVADPAAKPLPKPIRRRNPIDSLGLVLLVVGIGCIQFVLERGHAEDWFDSKLIVVCTFLGITSLIGLIFWELKTAHPILQLKLFKNASFTAGVTLMAGLGAMLYGLLFLVPVFVSTVFNFTATQTGELFIPGALIAAATMPFIGMQLRKRDPRQLIFVGIIGLSFAIYLISGFNSQTSVGGMFWPLFFRGAALAYLFVPINTTVLSQFSGLAIGQAAGMLNLCRQLGGSMAIALLGTLFQQFQVRSYSVLATHVTPFDVPALQASRALPTLLTSKMPISVGMGGLTRDALKILTFRAQKEAFVLAFSKTLFLASIAFLLCLIPLVFLKKPKQGAPIPDAH